MTKRHHATNYHRCSKCNQPLVKELKLCRKCELAIQEANPILSPSVAKRLGVQLDVEPVASEPTEGEVFRP